MHCLCFSKVFTIHRFINSNYSKCVELVPIIVQNEVKDRPSSLLIPCFLCLITTSSTKCSSPVCGYLERTFYFLTYLFQDQSLWRTAAIWQILKILQKVTPSSLSSWQKYGDPFVDFMIHISLWIQLSVVAKKWYWVSWQKIFPNVTDLIFLRPNLENFMIWLHKYNLAPLK